MKGLCMKKGRDMQNRYPSPVIVTYLPLVREIGAERQVRGNNVTFHTKTLDIME